MFFGDEQQLVVSASNGDANSFGELVMRYQTTVFQVCYRMLGERREAEDLAQETFLRAYQRLQMFDSTRPFGPWIRRIAANLCLNHLEAERTPAIHLNEEVGNHRSYYERDIEVSQYQREEADRIHRALLTLPPRYCAVIELRHFQELSYSEIAEALNLPLSDVKSHLFRARKMLSELLASQLQESKPDHLSELDDQRDDSI